MEETVSANIWHDRRYFRATSPTTYDVIQDGLFIAELTFNQFWIYDDGNTQTIIESAEELRQLLTNMKFSQNDEEHYILNYFTQHPSRHGRKLLDIGAFDGMTFSNTHALMKHGWEGIFIEASPKMVAACQRNLKGLNAHICQACIVHEPVTGMIPFYDNDQATATTSTAHVEKWKALTPFEPIMLMPVHYKSILSVYGKTFDMVSLDIEGQSAELFMKIFPEMPEVDLWVVEHDDRKEEIKALAQGFDCLYENGENVVLGRVQGS